MQGTGGSLFKKLNIGTLELQGRLIKSATSETRASRDGYVTRELIDFYLPMARSGLPLIITGNMYVSRDGQSTPRQLAADSDNKIPQLRQLTEAVHKQGGRIFAQLSHCGRQVLPDAVGGKQPVSASGVKDTLTGVKPVALSYPEIQNIVKAFGKAAGRCQQAGFDGIQIHAAHGYLISQFLTPHTNRRTDYYGGTLENRARILCEIHTEIREQVGTDFPVIIKLNGADALPFRNGLSTGELVEVAVIMEQQGIDAVEVSVGHYESGFPVVRGTFFRGMRAMVEGSSRHLPALRRISFRVFWPVLAMASNILWRHSEGFNLQYSRKFKAVLGIPVICVGGFLTREKMEAAIESGDCDAVSSARALIADPCLFQHLRDGTRGPRCTFCNACVGNIGRQPVDCYHPSVRRQKDIMLAGKR